jgi:hypothetical protein
MNDRGDEVFSAVNQAGGKTSKGIYLIPAGSTTPTKVAQPGDVCPSPCPALGQSFLGVSGPLAIGEAGEVAFAAELSSSTPTPTWVLYLYSPADGSYRKIVADGSVGDPTPVGGFFTSQNFFASVGIIETTGDVIFSDIVTGGKSAGGIFRFVKANGTITKVVAQGDAAPPGVTGILGVPQGVISGKSLVFYASVAGGNTNQIIGFDIDITQSIPQTTLVAYEGEATGTVAGGKFADPSNIAPEPFAFYGEGPGAPIIRSDGAVLFSSLLVGSSNSNGTSSSQGLFAWNGKQITKIVVNGDTLSNSKKVNGVLQFIANDIGHVYYFATEN